MSAEPVVIDWVEIGPCRLACADCRDVLPLLGPADACITDPPYGISLQNHCVNQCWDGSRRQSRTPDDWSISGDESHEMANAIRNWSLDAEMPLAMFGSAYKPYLGDWRNILVWNKGPAVGGGGDTGKCWKRTHELIFITGNGPLRGSRDSSVIDWPVVPTDFEFHQAQKPVGLLVYLIEQLTDADNTIVDPCMGSGSTLVACIQAGRKAIGIELDPKHFETAARRCRDAWQLKKSELPFDKPKPEVQRTLLEHREQSDAAERKRAVNEGKGQD